MVKHKKNPTSYLQMLLDIVKVLCYINIHKNKIGKTQNNKVNNWPIELSSFKLNIQ